MTNEIAITGTFRSGFYDKEPIALTDEIQDNLLQEYQEDINKRVPLVVEYDAIDSADTPGIYYVHYDEDNVIGILFVTSSDGVIQQKFSTTYSISNGELLPEYTKTQDYFRHNGNGQWTEWQTVHSEKDSFVIYANVADADGEEGVDNDVPIVAGQQGTIRELYYALIEKGIQNVSVYLEDTEVNMRMICLGQDGDSYTKNGKQCIRLVFQELPYGNETDSWTYSVFVFIDGSLIITRKRPKTTDEVTYYIEIDSNNQIFSINDNSSYTLYLNKIYSRVKAYVNLKYTHIYLISDNTQLQCIGYDGKFIFYNPSGNTLFLTLTKNGNNISYTIEESTSAKYDELQEQIDNIIFKDVTCTCTTNKSNFYKGFPISITITGSTNSDEVSKIYIMDGDNDNVIENLANKTNSKSVTYTFNSTSTTRTFKCIAQYRNGKSKTSSMITVTARNPIFTGTDTQLTDLSNFDVSDYVDSNISESLQLYSNNSPVSSLSGRTLSFTLTNSSRVVILTSDSKLGAKEGGFMFPFYRYSGITYQNISYYLYVSQNTYSNGTHTLIFNSDENY